MLDCNQFANLYNFNSKSEIDFGNKKIIKDRIINYNIKNFYMNDSISRSSETMAKCSKEILEEVA